MGLTIDKSKLENVVDTYSGIRLTDTAMTIQSHLNKQELFRYTKSMNKVEMLQGLNLKDLKVLDKIDALTFELHGMCLKDSLVTKARLKACKKYKVKFIDRDGLVDHMNCMLPKSDIHKTKSNNCELIGKFFIEKLGNDSPYKLSKVLQKLGHREDLDFADLNFLSEMEAVTSRELDWTITDPELIEAIKKACKKLGIYFQNLQQVISH